MRMVPVSSTAPARRILFAPTTAHSIAWRRAAERFVTMEMQDRTVVVTGGASGIGKATALLLAREGAVVFVGDVEETGGRAVAAEAADEGLAIEFLPLDLTQTATIAEFAAT